MLPNDFDKWTYAKRARFGATLKGKAKELTTHAPPAIPEVKTAEGFSELLPAPSTNVSKHYHEHLAGLHSAASSDDLKILVEEVRSASLFHKKLAVGVVAAKLKNDSELAELIRTVVPAVRLKLLHACIESRRVAVLEEVLPKLQESYGLEYVAGIVHGCSSAVVPFHNFWSFNTLC